MKNLFRYWFGTPSKSFPVDLHLMYWFRDRNLRFLARYQRRKLYTKYKVQIHMQSQIPKSVIFPHPIGIVLGAVSIGENCMILQNVTMGESSKKGLPTIGNNTSVYAGAVIGGGIFVGSNCIIGANSVVTRNVDSNCLVVGANRVIEK